MILASSSLPRAVPWLALACILISYVVSIVGLHPTNFFGLTEDDAIYFSSAQALAQGKGYVLPSVPGTPPATKYPILYPWILSWVWRANPSFPSNLPAAVRITVVFGTAFITAAFIFLRRLDGIGELEALFLTAFCALHPLFLYYSSSILSDVPFAALALAAMILSDRAIERGAGVSIAALCGILAGLCMSMRVFGVPVAAGILAAAALRRAWRQSLIFVACVCPFFFALAWRVLFDRTRAPLATAALPSSLGWTQTWAYYTSYLDVWKLGVPDAHTLWAIILNNAGIILRAPSDNFLAPSLVRDTPAGHALIAVVSAIVVAGIVRQARGQAWKPIHYVLPCYLAVTLFWNYPDNRFSVPFWPLFAAGLWVEGKHLGGMVRATLSGSSSTSEKALAMGVGLLLAGLVCGMVVNYVGSARTSIFEKSVARGLLLREKRQGYDWLTRFSAPGSRVIAYEDASTYLYTGRAAMRPIMFDTAEFYNPARLRVALEHMTDVPLAIRADFWIVADDDFDLDFPTVVAGARARTDQLEHALPLAYRSQNGRVRIYSLKDCLARPESPSCQATARAFPGTD
jgi:hypothetical protein